MKKAILILILLNTQVFAEVKPAITSFNAGEVSPLLLMRSDFAKYDNACKQLQNMLVLSQGPVRRRPGTKYIAEVKDSSKAVRLIPFEYSKTDAYIIEFGDEYARFYRNGGQIVDSTGTEDLSNLNNITAHWLLNEQSGTNVADDDGGTHDGTASADATILTATAKVGTGSFDLDTQYTVERTDHGDFSFTDDSSDSAFSIACWAYVEDISDIQVLLSKWRNANATREWRFSLSAERKLQLHLADTSATLSATNTAQWKLNETGASQTLDNAEGTAGLDATASQNANSANFSQTGITSTCFDWAATHFATVSDGAALSFDDSGSNPMSIAAWIYVTNTANAQVIFSKWEATGAAEYRFYLDPSEKLCFDLWDVSASAGIFNTTDNALSEGWHFVTVTYNSTGGSNAETGVILYVDNVSVAFSTGKSGTYAAMENTATNALIAAQYISTTESYIFADKIDNVMLFKTAILSVADIGVLYNSGDGTETLSASEVFAISDSAVALGWRFLGATYSAPSDESTAAGGIILYVDSSAVSSTATNSASYTAMQDGAEEIRIGSQRNSADSANENFWADKIDEMSVFSDVLTATEIASLYSTATYEISTPYTQSELSDIQFAQSADLMYLVQENHSPYKLSRLQHALWTIEDVNYITGPFKDENSTTTTITPSATTGVVVLTASTSIFKSDDVGAIWEIRHPRTDATLSGSFTSATSSSAIDCEGDYKLTTHGTWTGTFDLERSYDDSTWEKVSGGHLNSVDDDNVSYSGSEDESGYTYRVTMTSYTSGTCTYDFVVYDHMHTGVVKIASFVNPTNVSATVHTTLGGTTATEYWSEGYWSDKDGWPQTIEFHEFRLWYGGSANYPQTLWSSRTDDFENMKYGSLDSHAMIYTLPNQNPIQWLLSHTYLMIGTLGGAGRLGYPDEEMTPSTKPAYRHQTTDGSAYIQATLAGDAILYVERGGQRVREFVYTLERDKFVSPDMTVLAEHITGDGIEGIAFQSRPEKLLWSYREDGNFLSMSYNREQDVVAWAENITDGDVESVAVIPGTEEDEVWFVVERTIDGSTVRYIEQMQPHDWGSDDNDTFFVDSGLTFDGGVAVNITNVTQADPAVVTVSSWPADGDGTNLADGDQITIASITGMTELNGNVYTIDDASVTGLTLSLDNSAGSANIDSTGYTAYSTGGTAQRVENSFSGYDHLEGETVAILADGAVQTSATVSSGAFSISDWANKMHAGLPFTSILETMPIVFEGQKGSVAADKKQVSLVAMNFYDSLGTKYGVSGDTDNVFTETSLFTGWKRLSFQHGFRSPDTTIYITQVKPLPLTIRAIVPSVTVTE